MLNWQQHRLYVKLVKRNNRLEFTRQLPQAQFIIAICAHDDPCTTDETLLIGNYRLHAYIMGGPAKNLFLIDPKGDAV